MDEPQKDEPVKDTSVYNASKRAYGTPDGQTIESGASALLTKEHAERMIAAYPGDIVSPDTYRAPGSRSAGQLEAENKRLEAEVEALRKRKDFNGDTEAAAQLAAAQKAAADATAQLKDLQTKLDQATASGATESEQVTNLTAQVAALQTQLADAQKATSDALNANADLEAQLQTEKDGAQSFADAVQAKVTAYNAALDILPAGAVAPHFMLEQSANPGS